MKQHFSEDHKYRFGFLNDFDDSDDNNDTCTGSPRKP